MGKSLGIIPITLLLLWTCSAWAAPNPAAKWTLNSISGNTIQDSSGNNLTGTISGGVTGVSGKSGQALSFNGTNGLVSIGNNSLLAISGDTTFSAWIKTSNTTRDETIVAKYDSSGNERGFVVKVKSDGHLAFRIGGSNSASGKPFEIVDSTSIVNDGQWHFVVVIVQPNQAVLFYVDGNLSSYFLNTSIFQSSATPNFVIGGPVASSNYFTGVIDELNIYKANLNSAEIAEFYGATPVTNSNQATYNGIVLPAVFPPKRGATQVFHLPTYITNPPLVIPINIGRQLFIDDFLIDQTNLTRTQHQPVMHSGNPILAPDSVDLAVLPFSGGAFFDPTDSLIKMWYYNWGPGYVYASSKDGVNWDRDRQSSLVGGDTVWLDQFETNPAKRFKAFRVYPGPGIENGQVKMWNSSNGLTWSADPRSFISKSDRTTVFYNPFRKVWVNSDRKDHSMPASSKRGAYSPRVRFYSESPDLTTWTPNDPIETYWTGPDDADPPYGDDPNGEYPELYNLDAVGYESLMVGLFSWFYPGEGYRDYERRGPILVEIGAGFSRDGFQWVRPTRSSAGKAFIPASNIPNTWNGYNTQSVGGCFLVVGDELWFYFTGRTQKKPNDGAMSTGLAKLRRDGFYSMDAGSTPGTLTTKPLTFSGKYMFVNVANAGGSLQIEALDGNNNVIAPFTKANSVTISTDRTMQAVTWNGVSDLSSLIGRQVKFRFTLTNGSLYSFWVTPDTSGASRGYVAAGGPGFSGPTDTVGSAAGFPGAQAGTVAKPQITPDAGSFNGGVTVTMSSSTPGASIRYTTDGSQPTSSSTLYTGAISVTVNRTIKAIAIASGLTSSVVTTASYIINPDVNPSRVFGLPSGTQPFGTSSTNLGLQTNTPATCKYDTSPNVPYASMAKSFSSSDGRVHSAPISGLQNGSLYNYYVKCRTPFGASNPDDYLITFAVAPSSSSPAPYSLYMEAEAGQIVAPMVIASDANAKGGQYVISQTPEQGAVSLGFSVPVTGDYIVWARIMAQDGNRDSLYVAIDNGPTDVFDEAQQRWSSNWQWNKVNGRDNGNAMQVNPRIFTLAAGSHTLHFRGREVSGLDRVFITNSLSAVPSDSGNSTPPGVTAPSIASFTASPATIASGSSTLSWSVSNATSVSINQGVGDVTSKTSQTVSPSSTTTYTLTATNSNGSATSSVTVTVSASVTPTPTLAPTQVPSPTPSPNPNPTNSPTPVPTGAPSIVINISPLAANLIASGNQTFTAAVAVGGGGGSGVTWSITPNVGTIAPNGNSALYTAPSSITSQQLVTIKATSSSNPAVSAQAYINLQPAAPTPSPGGGGNSFYVSPTGSASGNGSITNPWNLATALNHPSAVKPGDTIWLRNGTYGNGGSQTFSSRLTGTATLPIYVRQYPGERATINGGLGVSGKYVWYWGFEVANLNWPWRVTGESGSFPGGKPADAVFCTQGSVGNKFINMIIHDGADGIADQSESTETEAHGNLSYNNGWFAPDRGHGHNFYYQNPSTTISKLISDNIGYNSFDINFQAYGSAGPVQNLNLDGNIFFNGGVPGDHRVDNILMAAGGTKKGIVITNTIAYNPTEIVGATGYNQMDAVWAGGMNKDVTLRNNYWIGGTSTAYNTLLVRNWESLIFQNNLVIGKIKVEGVQSATWGGNTYYNTSVPSGDNATARTGLPSGVTTLVRPNKYEKGRANIAVVNWEKRPTVSVDLSASGLKVGTQYDIRDSQNYWGAAVMSGTYDGNPINLPMADESAPVSQITGNYPTPPHTSREFGAFILLPRGGGEDQPVICNPAVQCVPAPANCSYLGGDSCSCGQLQCTPPVISSAPSINSFTANPPALPLGGTTILSWSVTGGDSLSIDQGIGDVTGANSITVSPTATITYTLTAVNSAGTKASTATVTVLPPLNGTSFITSQSLGAVRSDFSGWVGMSFTTGVNPITVRSLGRIVGPGNSGSHVVKLVDVTGGNTDVPGGSVTVSTTGGVTGVIKYTNLPSPIVLQGNRTYILASQETSGGDKWYDQDTTVQTTAVGSVVSAAYFDTSWKVANGARHTYGPVNFTYGSGAADTLAPSPPKNARIQ